MDWLKANYQWLFDGAGIAVAVPVCAWIIKRLCFRDRSTATQRQSGGANSVNIQAGRDASVGDVRQQREK